MMKILCKEVNHLEGFSISEINDEIFSRIAGKSFKVVCTVPLSELRYVKLLHRDLSGKILRGEMICNVRIAEDLLDIFQKFFVRSSKSAELSGAMIFLPSTVLIYGLYNGLMSTAKP